MAIRNDGKSALLTKCTTFYVYWKIARQEKKKFFREKKTMAIRNDDSSSTAQEIIEDKLLNNREPIEFNTNLTKSGIQALLVSVIVVDFAGDDGSVSRKEMSSVMDSIFGSHFTVT
ncbi:Uncharacterized protein Fot_36519 [Forsythia ovata]|uniref:EF-hand domain-containing protein n=1 Tax=Forsythia ovata TaxID=205694 RepID=A0ABD1SPM9_9LAMI